MAIYAHKTLFLKRNDCFLLLLLFFLVQKRICLTVLVNEAILGSELYTGSLFLKKTCSCPRNSNTFLELTAGSESMFTISFISSSKSEFSGSILLMIAD